MRTSEVFVVNRQPSVTYTSRTIDNKRLEDRLIDHVAEGGQVLVVSGPSKSGKSVLLRHQLPEAEAVWIPGARVKSMEDVWDVVIMRLKVATQHRKGLQRSDQESESSGLEGGVKPGGVGGTFRRDDATAVTDTSIDELVKEYSKADAASEGLKNVGLPVVVDDFHLMPEGARKDLIGAFRSLIENGLALVLAAVPHRAGDVVKAQANMKGRVDAMHVGLWTSEELHEIPRLGFAPNGLNCAIEPSAIECLTKNAFKSPMLMQKLCLELTKLNGVQERLDAEQRIEAPASWEVFFAGIAESLGEDSALRALADGRPTKGTPRQIFDLGDGDAVDIYPLLLRAIARTGPEMDLPLSRIAAEASELRGETVKADRCSSTLGRMSGIASDLAAEGEDPVLEFTDDKRLHLLDPYLAFSLAWGGPVRAA